MDLRRLNKICCFEIAKRTDGNRQVIREMLESYRVAPETPPAAGAPPADLRGPAKPTGRRRALEARVLRSKTVRAESGEDQLVRLRLEVDRPRALRVLRALASLPAGAATEARTVELDLIGSMVWRACNGATRVCDIVEQVRRDLQVSHREAELSVTTYVRTLGNRGLVSVELAGE